MMDLFFRIGRACFKTGVDINRIRPYRKFDPYPGPSIFLWEKHGVRVFRVHERVKALC
jgi:hypothetical protein